MISTYNTLTKSNKASLRDMILEIKPDIGPWGEVITLLRNCDDAFNESAASISQKGMPLNRIACVAHMLCDERFLACTIPLSDATTGSAARGYFLPLQLSLI